VLRGNKQKLPEICGDTVAIRPRGVPCFLLAGDLEGNAPIRSPLLFGHFPKCLHYSVIIAEKVCNPFLAFPKELPIPFRFCSNGLQELLGSFSNVSRHRFRYFLYISLEAACFCLLRLKHRRQNRKISKPSAVLLPSMIYPTIPLIAKLKLV
jgi:hypothetical protein